MIFLKPISKGNFRLPLLVDTEEKIFSMHPNIYIYFPGSPIPKLMLPLCTERPAYDQSQAARCTQAQNRPRSFCRTRTKADLPKSSVTAYTLQVLDSLIKIVNYIKSGALSFSGTSVS